MQGEGGYIVPPAGWLRDLRELCDRHGILLVADEVQCGVGRTGKMWACEHEGVEPDILLTAKGLGSGMPIGAIVARESISTWESGSHGSTYGGNPVCCAAALATLDLVEGGLMANAVQHGRAADGRAPEAGGEARLHRRGARPRSDDRRRVREGPPHPGAGGRAAPTPWCCGAFQRGLLLLGAGKSTLRLAPPLVVDEQDVDTALAIIDGLLGELD